MRSLSLTALTLTALLGGTASVSLGASIITFDTADAWNDVPGVAGGGWNGPWSRSYNNATTLATLMTRTKESSDPLIDAPVSSANYIHAVTLVGQTAPHVLARQILATAATNDEFEQNHQVSVDYRSAASTTYEPTLYSQSTGLNTTTTAGYMIRPISGFWNIYNGNRAGGGAWIPTTIAYAVDTTYHFDIDVDVTTGSYDVKINGTDVDAGLNEVFGFRSNVYNNKSYLNFSLRGDALTTQSFDVDNLVVTVPEPAAFGLLGVSALALARRRV